MNIPSNLFHEKQLILFASKTTEVQIKYKQKGIPQKKKIKKIAISTYINFVVWCTKTSMYMNIYKSNILDNI